jgi:hypothetical protein
MQPVTIDFCVKLWPVGNRTSRTLSNLQLQGRGAPGSCASSQRPPVGSRRRSEAASARHSADQPWITQKQCGPSLSPLQNSATDRFARLRAHTGVIGPSVVSSVTAPAGSALLATAVTSRVCRTVGVHRREFGSPRRYANTRYVPNASPSQADRECIGITLQRKTPSVAKISLVLPKTLTLGA